MGGVLTFFTAWVFPGDSDTASDGTDICWPVIVIEPIMKILR
jgi:hypothetical protein